MASTHQRVASDGLTPLYEPEDALVDIVFIHGFNGHPERTWTYKRADADPPSPPNDLEALERPSKFRKLNPFRHDQERESSVQKETYWPRDLLPRTVDKARILTFGYDTAVHHKFGQPRNQNTVYDFAWEFLNCLGDARQSDAVIRRPLVFIAHSLGGIITKEALRQASLRGTHQSDSHLRNIFSSTLGIIFFGTPHRGSDPRGFLQHVAEKAVRAAGFTVNQKIFETLLPDSERLKQLLDEFPLLVNRMKWKIVSFREKHGMAVLNGKKVVDDISSCLGDSSLEIVRDMESDHRDMCRFSGLMDPRYEKVAAAINRIIQHLLVESNNEVHMEEPGSESRVRTSEPKLDGPVLSEGQHTEMMDKLRFKQMDARLLTLKTAQTKTCRWLLKNRRYQDWTNAEKIRVHHGFFWIKGKPGTGKSILMKFLLSEAKKTMRDSIVISFFFNARGGELEKSTQGLYRSLLLQLLEKAPETRGILDYYGTSGFNAIKEGNRWPNEMLREAFALALEKLGNRRIVCYIDALDECPEDDVRDMISFFEELGELERAAESRVCFSSRHYPEISIRTGLQLVLESEQDHKNDITLYIDKHLNLGTDTHAEDIKAEILEKSSNIFLWVALVIPILNKEYDRGRIKALKKRLGETPAGLHELFLDILTRDRKNVDELLVCIQAILFAARPFKPEELRIVVETGCEEDLSDGPCDPAQMTPDNLRKFVLDASKGLAEITKSNERTVQFIHESVRDFLLQGGLEKLLPTAKNIGAQGHDTLKRICLVQISRYAARPALLMSDEGTTPNLAQKYPLSHYAADHVCFHANRAQKLGLDQTAFLENFDTIAWLHSLNRLSDIHNHPHLLYYLGEYGCADLIAIHPERQKHLELKGGRFIYPLAAALYAGKGAAARAFVNLPPLYEEHSTKLTETKSRYNSTMKKDGFNKKRCLPSLLCEFGDVEILRTVLESGHIGPMDTATIKECFAQASSEGIVEVLLEFGAFLTLGLCDSNPHVAPLDVAKDGDEPALFELPHLELALRRYPSLIDKAEIWPCAYGYKGLLSYAAERGFEQIAKLCVKNTHSELQQNALFCAVSGHMNQSGRLAIIKILLDTGVNLRTSQDPLSYTLIFKAMSQTHNDEVVTFLLSTSSLDLEVKRGDLTPLLSAIQDSRKTFVKLLLSAGSDPMALNRDGVAALTLAVKLSDLTSFRCILENPKCEINARDYRGRTALSWCMTVADETAISMTSDLLKRQTVHRNSMDDSGQTVLTRAVRSGNLELVKSLLSSARISPDLASRNGVTPLMLAVKLSCCYPSSPRVFWEISKQLLLTGNVDPGRQDRHRTPFGLAKTRRLAEFVRLMEYFCLCREMDQIDALEDLNYVSL